MEYLWQSLYLLIGFLVLFGLFLVFFVVPKQNRKRVGLAFFVLEALLATICSIVMLVELNVDIVWFFMTAVIISGLMLFWSLFVDVTRWN